MRRVVPPIVVGGSGDTTVWRDLAHILPYYEWVVPSNVDENIYDSEGNSLGLLANGRWSLEIVDDTGSHVEDARALLIELLEALGHESRGLATLPLRQLFDLAVQYSKD